MVILLTNDDGIKSEGLCRLKDTLSGHEVWIVAPDRERSGTSHSITLKKPVCYIPAGERTFSCSGTPADCVLYSLLGALPVRPDLIISGINHGPNLGTDIVYSGTAAAARQGALLMVPSIAVSAIAEDGTFPFERAAAFVAANLNEFISSWREDLFININIPPKMNGTAGTVITYPSRRIYQDRIELFMSPFGERYYMLHGDIVQPNLDPESDWGAVKRGEISISPIFLHPVNHGQIDILRKDRFKAE